MIYLYQWLLTCLLILGLPLVPVSMAVSEKRRHGLLHRLGLFSFLNLPPCAPGKRRIWVHALSVGEVRSAQPLMDALVGEDNVEVVFTASTMSGLATARELYLDIDAPRTLGVGYFPFDIWWAVSAAFQRIAPHDICLIETDLWPWFLKRAAAKNIRVSLVNARMSQRSLTGYLRLKALGRFFFGHLSQVLVQTRLDGERFQAVGVPSSRIQVTGNMKFDQKIPKLDDSARQDLEGELGIEPGQTVCLAGSTHAGEEEMIFSAWKSATPHLSRPKLILAPRDINRTGEILALAEKSGLSVACHSRIQSGQDSGDTDLTLIDGFGILARAYALCDLAFIGGSLVPSGGHNPLEAAMLGKPVLFGPHMTDFLEPAELLTRGGGARMVADAGELAKEMIEILTHEDLGCTMGQQGAEIYQTNQGAVARTVERIVHA